MTVETKAYIEQHINQIENNGLASVYLRCPLRILNDFNNTLHSAGIDYPLEVHNYVVVCCYITTRFKNVGLHSYDFDYKTEKEEFEFICTNCLYLVEQLNYDLSVLLRKRSVKVTVEERFKYTSRCMLSIKVIVT